MCIRDRPDRDRLLALVLLARSAKGQAPSHMITAARGILLRTLRIPSICVCVVVYCASDRLCNGAGEGCQFQISHGKMSSLMHARREYPRKAWARFHCEGMASALELTYGENKCCHFFNLKVKTKCLALGLAHSTCTCTS